MFKVERYVTQSELLCNYNNDKVNYNKITFLKKIESKVKTYCPAF